MGHILTAKIDPEMQLCDEHTPECECWEDFVELTLECDGGRECRTWYECFNLACMPTEEEEDQGGDHIRHGKIHRIIEDSWMIETNECGGQDACDDQWFIYRENGLGRHKVEVEYWGDGCWALHFEETLND